MGATERVALGSAGQVPMLRLAFCSAYVPSKTRKTKQTPVDRHSLAVPLRAEQENHGYETPDRGCFQGTRGTAARGPPGSKGHTASPKVVAVASVQGLSAHSADT